MSPTGSRPLWEMKTSTDDHQGPLQFSEMVKTIIKRGFPQIGVPLPMYADQSLSE